MHTRSPVSAKNSANLFKKKIAADCSKPDNPDQYIRELPCAKKLLPVAMEYSAPGVMLDADERRRQARKEQALAYYCVLAAVALDIGGLAISISIMPFFVRLIGGSARDQGQILAAYNLGNMCGNALFGWLSDRVDRRIMIMLSITGSGTFFFLSALAPNPMVLLVIRTLLGLFSSTLPVANAYLADLFDKDTRVQPMAMAGSLLPVAVAIGPVVGNILARSPLGLRTPFYAGALSSTLALVVAVFVLPSQERAKELRDLASEAKVDSTAGVAQQATDNQQTKWSHVYLLGASAMLGSGTIIAWFTVLPYYIEHYLGWGIDGFTAVLFMNGMVCTEPRSERAWCSKTHSPPPPPPLLPPPPPLPP